MEDKIRWMLLSEKNRPQRKMKELKEKFDKKKREADLTSDSAVSIMNDLEKAQKMGVECITYMDDSYPDELRHIAYPPPYLYLRGNVKLLDFPVKVTIVGSRDATSYGMNVANEFAYELASNNICIVSGGARGIDSAALRGALRTDMGTIAVIGTGIDVDYPPENKELFKKVAEKGLIISEFPMGMGPLGRNFPVRNRIMTALADSVVVVEAAKRSGALISAEYANEQGKTLFAVPGNIDSPNSVGTNELIRDGANMAMCGSDILYEIMERIPDKYRRAKGYITKEDEILISEVKNSFMGNKREENPISSNVTPNEKAVMNAISSGRHTYEEIFDFCALETNKLTSLLTIMEIKGIIKRDLSNKYILND
ncbi:MAG: DNA-processing protein DprA [Clostridia bacterium]